MVRDCAISFSESCSPELIEETTVLSVQSGLLPIFLWEGIKVRRRKELKLTSVERLMLEIASDWGSFAAEDLEEITSIPVRAIHRIAMRLARLGTLACRAADTEYYVVAPSALQALSKEVVFEDATEEIDFLYLPRTDDLVAIHGDSSGVLTYLRRLKPVMQAPVPDTIANGTVHEILSHGVAERRIIGLPSDVVEILVPSDDEPIPEFCNAFVYSGRVSCENGTEICHLKILSNDDRARRQLYADIHLGSTSGLHRELIHRLSKVTAEWVATTVMQQLVGDKVTPDAVSRTAPSVWSVAVAGENIPDVGHSNSLLKPLAVLLDFDSDLVLGVALQLRPGDNAAKTRFVIEHVVEQILLEHSSIGEERILSLIKAASAAFKRTRRDATALLPVVKERLWELKVYNVIYALREADDFHYE